jgi:dihydroxyacetone kinase-like predicted kinase
VRITSAIRVPPSGPILQPRRALEDAAGLVLRALVGDAPEILTVIEGEGSAEAVTERILARARALRPDLGIQVLRGGQPHQAYALGVE